MKTQTYDFPQIGCYASDHHGQDANDKFVIRLAESYGYTPSEGYIEFLEKNESDEDQDYFEYLSEESDNAIEFLNDLETRSYHYWSFEDGNFGLWINVDGAKEDVDDQFNDLSEVSLDFEGEFLLINDHGNVSMYVRSQESFDDGERRGTLVIDKLIWDIV